MRKIALVLVVALLAACGPRPGASGPPTEGRTMMPMDGHAMEAPASPAGELTLKRTMKPDPPAAGQPAEVALTVAGPSGPVTAYDVVHDKQAHLVVISRDLSEFQHLHPDLDSDGTWRTRLTFPQPGPYRLWLDVTPTGASQQVLRSDVTVPGEASAAPVELDPSPKTVQGVQVEFAPDPAQLRTGDAMLAFRLSAGGQPVTDLQPYLGAMGHLVIVDESGERFLHAHPMEESSPAARGGPEVAFHTTFPSPGLYKMWAQFQRGGQVLTAPFVVRVQ